jgi:hypothetical protein
MPFPLIAAPRRFAKVLSSFTFFHSKPVGQTLLFSRPPYPRPPMPTATRPPFNSSAITYLDTSPKVPHLGFNDSSQFNPNSDNDQMMIFGPLDFEDVHMGSGPGHLPWEPLHDSGRPIFLVSSNPTPLDYDIPPPSPTTNVYAPVRDEISPSFDNPPFLGNWVNDSDFSLTGSPASPIPIPSSLDSSQSSSFIPFSEQSHFPPNMALSPGTFAALHPLPRSLSPTSPIDELQHFHRQRVDSISPQDVSAATPSWATQLWDGPSSLRSPSISRHTVRHSPLCDSTVRQRIPGRRGSITSNQIFQSSSAPSVSEARAPSMTRSYSRRAESVISNDDRDATIRKKKRTPPADEPPPEKEKGNDIREYFQWDGLE